MRRSSPECRAVLFATLCALAACQGQCFKPPAQSTLSVDLVSPADGQSLTVADDVAAATAGFQLDVVAKAADSGGNPVALASATVQTRLTSETTFSAGPAGQIAGDTVTFPAVELREGANAIQVNVTESGSSRTATKTITVNVNLSQPQVLTFRFQGDANGDAVLNLAEQATGAPVALLTTQGVEDGQTITIKDQGAAGTVYGTGTVTAGAASVTLSGLGVTDTTEASYQLVATVSDLAGRSTTASKTLMVDRVSPALTILSPTVPAGQNPGVILRQVDDADATLAGFQVRITVQTSPDVGANGVVVTRFPGGMDALTPDGVTHQVSDDFTVPDTGPFSYAITVGVTDLAGNPASRTFTIQLGDSSLPGFFANVRFTDTILDVDAQHGSFKFPVRRNVPVGGTQSIVAVSNVAYWAANSTAEIPSNVIVDQGLQVADAQVIITGVVAGAAGCTPRLLYNGSPLVSGTALTTDSAGPVSLSATLTSGTSGTLRFAVDCGGGKVLGPSTNLVVDVDPPSPIVPTLTLLTSSPFTERRPGLSVTWPGGNDDGSTGGGSPMDYQVGWSTDAATPHASQPVGASDYDVLSGIESDLMYWNPVAVRMGPFPESSRTAQITGLPSIGAYYVQVRARDDVGNLSTIAPTTCAAFTGTPINGTCIDHQLNVATIANTGLTNGCIGYVMAAGDVNGDGRSDLAFVSASTQAQPDPQFRDAFIAYGNSNMSTFATSSARLVAPASTIDAVTGYYDVSVGNVGDRAGDAATADVIYAAPKWASGRGRYLVYFGQPGGGTLDTANPVEIRGLGANSNVSVGSRNDVGWARVVPDFSRPGGGAPDGFSELAISAVNENGGLGRVYLFYGRSHSTTGAAGSWEFLRQTDTDGVQYIPITSADRVFDGEAPPTCVGCPFTPANPTAAYFGSRRGYTSLGDIDGDGVVDFTLPDARDFVNRMYLYSGAKVAQVPGTVAPSGAHLIQRLSTGEPTQGAVPSGTLRGFGSDAVGGLNILGGAGLDLVVGFAVNNSVSVYADATPAGFTGAPLSIAGMVSRFGRTLAVADVNGDGKLDLIIGSDAGIALGDGFVGGGYVMYNTGQAGAEFDSSSMGAHVSRLRRGPAETLRSDSMGIAVAAGDFNGDGVPDVAVADHRMGDPASTTQGKIFVRY